MKAIKQNSKNSRANKGFSLVESIISVLMVTLISSMLFIVVNLAKNTYESLEKNAEGQVLSAILTNKIQDELRYAVNVTGTSNPTYYSTSLGIAKCQIVSYDKTSGAKNKRLYIESNGNYDPLVSNSAYVFDLGADVDITYNSTDEEFTVDLIVYDSKQTLIETVFVVEQLNN